MGLSVAGFVDNAHKDAKTLSNSSSVGGSSAAAELMQLDATGLLEAEVGGQMDTCDNEAVVVGKVNKLVEEAVGEGDGKGDTDNDDDDESDKRMLRLHFIPVRLIRTLL